MFYLNNILFHNNILYLVNNNLIYIRSTYRANRDETTHNRNYFEIKFLTFCSNSGQANTEVIEEVDESGRPKQKVALLYGPPGLGKTTLAHVVAKHAGYNVVEMNASDDRSIEGNF